MPERPALGVPGRPDLYFGPAHRNVDDTIDVTVYRNDHGAVLDLVDLPYIGWPAAAVRRVTRALAGVPDVTA